MDFLLLLEGFLFVCLFYGRTSNSGNHCKRMLERSITSFKCPLISSQHLLKPLHIHSPGQNNLYASSFSLKTSIYSRRILCKYLICDLHYHPVYQENTPQLQRLVRHLP